MPEEVKEEEKGFTPQEFDIEEENKEEENKPTHVKRESMDRMLPEIEAPKKGKRALFEELPVDWRNY